MTAAADSAISVGSPVHVFTYGSLMFAPVWRRVVSGDYRSTPALLTGYRRHRVRGAAYPALVAVDPGAEPPAPALPGVLYLAVDPADLQALDAFEGADYRRIRVEVSVAASAGMPGRLPADVYLYLAGDRIEPGDWDPGDFERDRLEPFLAEHAPARASD